MIEDVDLEKRIQAQNQQYFELYDKIAEDVAKENQIDILRANRQLIPETDNEVKAIGYSNRNSTLTLTTFPSDHSSFD